MADKSAQVRVRPCRNWALGGGEDDVHAAQGLLDLPVGVSHRALGSESVHFGLRPIQPEDQRETGPRLKRRNGGYGSAPRRGG